MDSNSSKDISPSPNKIIDLKSDDNYSSRASSLHSFMTQKNQFSTPNKLIPTTAVSLKRALVLNTLP